jgi:hypothetical protein
MSNEWAEKKAKEEETRQRKEMLERSMKQKIRDKAPALWQELTEALRKNIEDRNSLLADGPNVPYMTRFNPDGTFIIDRSDSKLSAVLDHNAVAVKYIIEQTGKSVHERELRFGFNPEGKVCFIIEKVRPVIVETAARTMLDELL